MWSPVAMNTLIPAPFKVATAEGVSTLTKLFIKINPVNVKLLSALALSAILS